MNKQTPYARSRGAEWVRSSAFRRAGPSPRRSGFGHAGGPRKRGTPNAERRGVEPMSLIHRFAGGREAVTRVAAIIASRAASRVLATRPAPRTQTTTTGRTRRSNSGDSGNRPNSIPTLAGGQLGLVSRRVHGRVGGGGFRGGGLGGPLGSPIQHALDRLDCGLNQRQQRRQNRDQCRFIAADSATTAAGPSTQKGAA